MRRAALIATVLVAVAVGGVVATMLVRPGPPALRAGTALAAPRPIGEFSLIDQTGEALGPARLEGRWSLVFTGFTHCPDVCPTTIALIAALRARLAREDLQFLFVSVDPDRDTPAQIGAYLTHFGPGLLGATGSVAQIERFTGALGLAQVRNPGVGGDYTFDHSAALVLIDPRARVAGYFTPPLDVDAIAGDLAGLDAG